MMTGASGSSFINPYVSEMMRRGPAEVPYSRAETDSKKSAGREKSAEAEAEAKAKKEQQAELEALRARDKEVRDHEMAHQVAAGQYFLGKSFEFTT
ncbi:MAG TPA: hypothetical protein ENN84_01435, partial [Candidatus Marinimicrobia bacterium]|nr:hypothetical protein [Candidatus Neomarinimicrobiota bacterium]